MAEESDLEKTEAASSRRLEQAREEGQVPRSREIGTFLVLMVGAAAFWLMGPWMVERVAGFFRRGLVLDHGLATEPTLMLVRLADISLDALLSFAPMFAALIVAALLSPFFLGSWNFSAKALQPDLSRLNLLKGLGRVISWNGLVELVKAVAKSSLVGGVAVLVLWNESGDLLAMFAQSIEVSLASAGHLLSFSFLAIVSAMLLIVAVDVPFQIWQYHHKLKMSRAEVKKEGKELEGNPEVKSRIRQLQREAARKRMMSAVPTADVIVTNPSHYAVALAYKAGYHTQIMVAVVCYGVAGIVGLHAGPGTHAGAGPPADPGAHGGPRTHPRRRLHPRAGPHGQAPVLGVGGGPSREREEQRGAGEAERTRGWQRETREVEHEGQDSGVSGAPLASSALTRWMSGEVRDGPPVAPTGSVH